MKQFRRIVSLVLICCMIVPMFAFAATDKETKSETKPKQNYYYRIGFDNINDGFQPTTDQGIGTEGAADITSLIEQSGKAYVTSVPSSEDKSFVLNLNGGYPGPYFTQTFGSAITGKVCVEFTMMIDDFQQCLLTFGFYDSNDKLTTVLATGANGNLQTGNYKNLSIKTNPNEFNTITFAIDLDKHTYDIYMNYRLREKGQPLLAALSDMKTIRFSINQRNSLMRDNGSAYFSEIKVYESDRALDPEAFANVRWSGAVSDGTAMKNNYAYIVGGPYANIKGKVVPIHSSLDVKPYFANNEEGEEVYVPADFVFENFGASVEKSAEGNALNIKYGNKNVLFTSGSQTYTLNGEEHPLTKPVESKYDRLFVPSKAVAEIMDMNIMEDTCGLVVFSEYEIELSWYDNIQQMWDICDDLIYEKVSGEQFVADLKKFSPDKKHPRIIYTPEEVARVKHEIETIPVKKEWFDELKSKTDNLIKTTPIPQWKTDTDRWFRPLVWEVRDIVEYCGLMYFLTDDKKYADKIWEFTEQYIQFPEWDTQGILMSTELLLCLGFAYDWLYNDYLTEEQKQMCIEAAKELGYKLIENEYANNVPWTYRHYNFNHAIDGASLGMMLAFGDELEAETISLWDKCYNSLHKSTVKYLPDGAWYEGTGYWGSIHEWDRVVAGMLTSLGTDYGLATNFPIMKSACWYPFEASSGRALFNFSDGDETSLAKFNTYGLAAFAGMLDSPEIMTIRYQKMKEEGLKPDWRDLFLYKGEPQLPEGDSKLDKYYRDSEVISFRNNWSTNSSLWVGMHSGDNTDTHSHNDNGVYCIEAFGTRFIGDIGMTNYTYSYLPQYAHRAEGHNILVIDPDGGKEDIDRKAATIFETVESNDVSAFAITDTTAAYKYKGIDSWQRGVKLTKGRTCVIIQDEVRSQNKHDVYWFAHTKTEIESISEDGKVAILNDKGNKMEVRVLSEDGKLYAAEARPLPFMPDPAEVSEDAPGKGWKKLAMYFEDASNLDITVAYTPLNYMPKTGMDYPEIKPLSEWTLDDPETSPLRVIPTVNDLKLNGETVKNFMPGSYAYENMMHVSDPIPTITVDSDLPYKVIYPDSIPGTILVEVENDHFISTYRIELPAYPYTLYDEGMTEHKFINFTADQQDESSTNPPSASWDNDLATFCSQSSPAWQVFELDSVQTVDYIEMALLYGDKRKMRGTVETSLDGKTWTNVGTWESSGTTLLFDHYAVTPSKAKFIRVNCSDGKYNDKDEWAVGTVFSLCEFKSYSK